MNCSQMTAPDNLEELAAFHQLPLPPPCAYRSDQKHSFQCYGRGGHFHYPCAHCGMDAYTWHTPKQHILNREHSHQLLLRWCTLPSWQRQAIIDGMKAVGEGQLRAWLEGFCAGQRSLALLIS